MASAEIRKRPIQDMRSSRWRHPDVMLVKINGETHCCPRAAYHDGKGLESVVTKMRDR